jgi:cysteamine dioxygenase
MDNCKRREFIKLSALGFAGIALQFNAISTYAQQANAHLGKWDSHTKLNWDAFLERLSQLAKSQHDLPWNQKRYIRQVKRLLNQCNFPEFENVKEVFYNYENKRENWFEAETLHKEVDFQVSLFQFEKGEYIPHHDHPNMTGVLNVVSGNLLARNFDFVEELAETREVTYNNGHKATLQKCVIKEVENEILKAGDVGILTADEGNIHSIMPNEFTQMVDVFTPAYREDTKANWYQVDEENNYNDQQKLYTAEYAIR